MAQYHGRLSQLAESGLRNHKGQSMKSFQIIVTSSNSPLEIPLNPRGGDVAIGATPSGSGNYTVEFSITPQNQGLTNNYFPISIMTGATTAEQQGIGPATVIRVTLTSGTDVTMDLAQSDV